MANWQKAAIPVKGKYLQNFSFDHKDCHFVCADFASRKVGDEGGELHDFEGGTWRWLKNDIEKCSKTKKENILIMTHIGMFRTGFEVADLCRSYTPELAIAGVDWLAQSHLLCQGNG